MRLIITFLMAWCLSWGAYAATAPDSKQITQELEQAKAAKPAQPEVVEALQSALNALEERKGSLERIKQYQQVIRSDTRVMAISSLSLKRRLTCYRSSAFIRRTGRQGAILPWAAFREKPLTVFFLNARTPKKYSSALTATPQEAKPVPDWHSPFPARSPSFALSR